ncbi:membrane protein of unknown function [Nitrospira moscoviensis]|uniref:Uncharacterized protein n=1 Tax=Nitrospira moscoviensis TaxID=42253 RepID=A0A0K2GCV0_NITMO|nr:membrane protein of unknown function [Nitrospira moscoviensis]
MSSHRISWNLPLAETRHVKEPKTSIWIGVVTFACALGVTLLDFLMPARTLPWYGLYVIPVVWIALWSAEEDVVPVTALAVIVSVLAMLRGFVSIGSLTPIPIGDRVIVVTAIWSTVLLAVLRKRARRTYRWINLAGRR